MTTETMAAPIPASGLTDDIVVYFNGTFMPLSGANVNIATHGLHYGTGCFEGVRAYWNEGHQELYVLKLREHVDRFFRSCGVLRIQPPFTQDEMHDLTLEMLRLNDFRSDVYIRPIAFKSARTIKLTLSSLADTFAMYAFPFGFYAHREGGLNVCVSPWRRIDDNTIPARAKVTGSYINASLATEDAARGGYDEALMLTQNGNLSEASSSNVFLVRHGKLITPSVADNILEGITREAVMDLARIEMGLQVDERSVGRTEAYVADEVFLTGTGVQIEPIASIDGRPVGTGRPGPITTELQALYATAVHNESKRYEDWCTPVHRVSR